jgi:hypothetical protein
MEHIVAGHPGERIIAAEAVDRVVAVDDGHVQLPMKHENIETNICVQGAALPLLLSLLS